MQDGLGSVRGVADAANGILEARHYDPYGQPRGSYDDTPFGFTGEPTDGNGLVYLRARYYSPALGVFPNLDPLEGGMEAPMSFNRYMYVEGNVMNLSDPTGMGCSDFRPPCSDLLKEIHDIIKRVFDAEKKIRKGLNQRYEEMWADNCAEFDVFQNRWADPRGTFHSPANQLAWEAVMATIHGSDAPEWIERCQKRIKTDWDGHKIAFDQVQNELRNALDCYQRKKTYIPSGRGAYTLDCDQNNPSFIAYLAWAELASNAILPQREGGAPPPALPEPTPYAAAPSTITTPSGALTLGPQCDGWCLEKAIRDLIMAVGIGLAAGYLIGGAGGANRAFDCQY